MHLSSASLPRADVGTLRIVHFKVLVFPHPRGIFFLAKSPVFGEAKHPIGFEDALQNFIWFFELLSNTRTNVMFLNKISKSNFNCEKKINKK